MSEESSAGSGRKAGVPVPEGFNPLAALDPDSDDFEENAALLAEAMIPVNRDSKEPYWDESARSLLAALFMWKQLHPGKE